jgi:transcriptional regulator with XRE-family HTH domain
MKFRIKEICKERGVTMEQIAKTLNITPNTLTRNVNGNPTIETLEKIATALNVPISELFEQPATDMITCPNCGKRFKIEE